jgi:hypothetical protein
VSLLDGGPDTLLVTPEIEVIDARRNLVRIPGPDTVAVPGRLQPLASDETATEGQQVSTLYRFICRDFPAGPWSGITGAGRDWDVVGEPARHNGSERTRHVTVTLRGREPLEPSDG